MELHVVVCAEVQSAALANCCQSLERHEYSYSVVHLQHPPEQYKQRLHRIAEHVRTVSEEWVLLIENPFALLEDGPQALQQIVTDHFMYVDVICAAGPQCLTSYLPTELWTAAFPRDTFPNMPPLRVPQPLVLARRSALLALCEGAREEHGPRTCHAIGRYIDARAHSMRVAIDSEERIFGYGCGAKTAIMRWFPVHTVWELMTGTPATCYDEVARAALGATAAPATVNFFTARARLIISLVVIVIVLVLLITTLLLSLNRLCLYTPPLDLTVDSAINLVTTNQ